MAEALIKCGDYYSSNRDAMRVKTSIMRRVPESVLEGILAGTTNPGELLKFAHIGVRVLALKYLNEVGFLEWLVTEENAWKIDIEIAKRKAADTMIAMAEMDAEGDAKLLSIKYNATKYLLDFDTEKSSTADTASMTFTMPKKYAHCSIEDIDNELLKLGEAES